MKTTMLFVEKASMIFAAIFFAGWFGITSWNEAPTLGDMEFFYFGVLFFVMSGIANIVLYYVRESQPK